MFKIFSTFLLIFSLFLSFSGNANALAKENLNKSVKMQNSRSNQILKNIEEKDPFKTPKKEGSKISKNTVLHTEYSSDTTLDGENKKINFTNKNGSLTIGSPLESSLKSFDLVDGKIIHSSSDKKFDVVSEVIDGGFRQVINIQSDQAPNSYDFPVTLEIGDNMFLSSNGGATIQNSKGVTKMIIGEPWAKDRNSRSLKTSYEIINGSALRQIIDTSNATFPIIADPIWCGSAIQDVTWIQRDGQWSASNNPTYCGRWNCGGGQWACWQESYDKTPPSSQWDKQWNTNQYWSMYNQYVCHADYAKPKPGNWNLEPWRADKGYQGFVNSSCN